MYPSGWTNSSPTRPDWHWGPPSLQFNGYWYLIPRVYDSWDMRLTTHLQLVLGVRISAGIPTLPPIAFIVCTGITLRFLFPYNILPNLNNRYAEAKMKRKDELCSTWQFQAALIPCCCVTSIMLRQRIIGSQKKGVLSSPLRTPN